LLSRPFFKENTQKIVKLNFPGVSKLFFQGATWLEFKFSRGIVKRVCQYPCIYIFFGIAHISSHHPDDAPDLYGVFITMSCVGKE